MFFKAVVPRSVVWVGVLDASNNNNQQTALTRFTIHISRVRYGYSVLYFLKGGCYLLIDLMRLRYVCRRRSMRVYWVPRSMRICPPSHVFLSVVPASLREPQVYLWYHWSGAWGTKGCCVCVRRPGRD